MLSEILDCEVDPALCMVRAECGWIYVEATVEDLHFRIGLDPNESGPVRGRVYEIETGRGVRRRWREFSSLAGLDKLLD